ncbi:MAG: hypothetical protein ACK5TS_08310, partial [Betaproteobacteria bacterium]
MSSTDTFLALDGPGALSAFRATRLLSRLRAIEPNITAVAARHVHLVHASGPLDQAARDKLAT